MDGQWFRNGSLRKVSWQVRAGAFCVHIRSFSIGSGMSQFKSLEEGQDVTRWAIIYKKYCFIA